MAIYSVFSSILAHSALLLAALMVYFQLRFRDEGRWSNGLKVFYAEGEAGCRMENRRDEGFRTFAGSGPRNAGTNAEDRILRRTG